MYLGQENVGHGLRRVVLGVSLAGPASLRFHLGNVHRGSVQSVPHQHCLIHVKSPQTRVVVSKHITVQWVLRLKRTPSPAETSALHPVRPEKKMSYNNPT